MRCEACCTDASPPGQAAACPPFLPQMCADGGQASAEAAALLAAEGYEAVAPMEGGYEAYCQVHGVVMLGTA